MKSRDDQNRDRIPLYVSDRLNNDEKRAFEEALENDPELQREVDEFFLIKSGYKGLEQDLPTPSERVFERIRENIQKETVTQKTDISFFKDLLAFCRGLFTMPRVAWSVAAVQLAVILFLVANPFQGTEYRTLSNDDHRDAGFQLQVVFKGEAMEQEIRSLLERTELQIKDGPDSRGLYILWGKEGEKADKSLEILQKSRIVRFAEKPY
jgi:hypothetical protein